MGSKTDAILLRIGADVSGASKNVNKLSKDVTGLSKAVEDGKDQLMKFAGIAAAGLGLTNAIASALAFGDSMTKLAQQTGLSTSAVQRLDFIASQTGTSVESITSAINKMQIQLVKAADGSKAQAEAFETLKINTEEFFRLDPEQQFQRIAEEIASTANPADQAAKAIAAFGKSGAELLPTLKAMGEQGAELSAEFEAIGGAVSADAIKALDDMGDAGARVAASTRAFVSELVAMGAPAAIAAMDAVTEFFGGLRVLVGAGSNELVNIDTKIKGLTESLEAFKRANPFPDAFGKSLIAQQTAEIEKLQLKFQTLLDAPAQAAKAADDARKAAAAQGPEELADIVVHEDAKTAVYVNKELDRQIALGQMRQEFMDKTLESMTQFEIDATEITKTGLDARELFTMQSYESQAATVAGELESITAGVAQHNKVLFNINKAAGIANAIISMHEGVAKSLSAYPMPLAGIMAAIHAAAGLARVQAIASTQYNGGGKGTSPSQAGTPPVPTAPAGGNSGGQGQGGAVGGSLMVQGIDPGQLYSGKMVRFLAEKLVEHQKNGGTVVLTQ